MQTSIRRRRGRKTKETFVSEAKSIHGDRFDYSKTKYKNSTTKVVIVCPKHGPFEQFPANHLNGKGFGCKKCAMENSKKTNDEFIQDAKEIYGEKYDYSKIEYKGSDKEVTLICPEYGEFQVKPSAFLSGKGLPGRKVGKRTIDKEEFVRRAREVHGDKYNYDDTVYVNSRTEITILCPEHGEFKQRPWAHLAGNGCPKCAPMGRPPRTKEQFLANVKKKYGDKYDYSKVEFVDMMTPVTIICPEHGEFEMSPRMHESGKECHICKPQSKRGRKKKTTEEYVKELKEKFGDKFDYSLVEYKGVNELIKVKCPKHGVFQQSASYHKLHGECPHCKKEKKNS